MSCPTHFMKLLILTNRRGQRRKTSNLARETIPKDCRFKLQYDDDTFSLSVGKITAVFHVTRPPVPRKKGAHQLRVGSKKIEPEKLLRSEERNESENPKNDGFIGKGLRIAPPQLKKK
ncbi:hypothetical protein PIB30_091727 [Stylosanthes scabra]|uniref:Uncharacterized protein n=1 Tax=Stylosanthes scabra TaxID=79078 RepID=A0ABU6XSI3_9FABA|nr:hypothetical protein [Stylosanthes scabra]